MKIIDSHFHFQIMKEKGLEIDSVASFLSGGIDAGCTLEDIEFRKEILAPYPHLKLACAIGPWCANELTENSIEEKNLILEKKTEKTNAFFIGEIGLDYYHNYGTPQIQKYLFISQMKLAEKLKKRVLIHSRQADEDTIDVIKKFPNSKGGVLHCFNGSEKLMYTALDFGYKISFAGNLTYKTNEQLRQSLKKIPLNRILLETDSPYLAPLPLRGTLNTPLNIIHTYRCACETIGISLGKLAETVFENFESFCQ